MLIFKLLITAFSGVTVGWVYSGYKFYGTIDPRKQTYDNLLKNKEKYKYTKH